MKKCQPRHANGSSGTHNKWSMVAASGPISSLQSRVASRRMIMVGSARVHNGAPCHCWPPNINGGHLLLLLLLPSQLCPFVAATHSGLEPSPWSRRVHHSWGSLTCRLLLLLLGDHNSLSSIKLKFCTLEKLRHIKIRLHLVLKVAPETEWKSNQRVRLFVCLLVHLAT